VTFPAKYNEYNNLQQQGAATLPLPSLFHRGKEEKSQNMSQENGTDSPESW